MKKDYRSKPVKKLVVIGESNAFGSAISTTSVSVFWE